MATSAPLPYDLDAPLGGLRFKDSADEELALLVAEASESAFAALYERHCQPLYRYCRSIVRDDVDAQDAFQTAWARALVALRRGQRDAPVRPWLYRIAHNESISVLRRRRRTQPLDDVDHHVGSAEDHALDRERFTSLVSDLQDLPERSRGALLMRELSGLSHEEIAAALDTSVSAARQCIYEARRELSDLAAGRATPCDDICRRISDGDRRVLRGRRIAAHLRDCPGCAAFASTIDTRRPALHALAPWLPAAAAAGVLHSAFRAGWGTGAAGTGAAGAGVAGTGAGAGAAGTGAGAGAAGTAAAGTTGAAMTSAAGPAAVTAGVVTKAVGVPLLGKSLLAVIALTAGVASVAGTGESGGTATTPARAHAVPPPLQAAPAGRLTPVPAFSRAGHRPSTLPSHGQGATPAQAATAAHGASRSAGGRHGAAGSASSVAPGQAMKITGAPPGQARKLGTAPPGQAAKAGTASPPGQAKKLSAAPPGQARKTATTPPDHAKQKATTPPGQAKKTTTPPGQATKSSTASSGQPAKPTTTPTSHANATSTTTPPGHANSTSTTPPGHSHASSPVAATVSDVSGNSGAAHAKLARSTP